MKKRVWLNKPKNARIIERGSGLYDVQRRKNHIWTPFESGLTETQIHLKYNLKIPPKTTD